MEISSFYFDVFCLKNKEMRSRNESDSKHAIHELTVNGKISLRPVEIQCLSLNASVDPKAQQLPQDD